MNVLITGVNGFVGGHLARAVAAIPNTRLFGTTLTAGEQPSSPDGVSRIQADITDLPSVARALELSNPDRIFHVAGQAFVPKSFQDPLETFTTNIIGTLNVLEAMRLRPAKNASPCAALVVSSGEVYGDIRVEDLPIRETFALCPSNPYATSKASADLLARQYRRTFGLNVVVARPFNHLGPGQNELFVGSAFAKQVAEIKAGKRAPKIFVGNLDPERDFTDVRDVVLAYISLLSAPQRDDVFNVCSGASVSIRRILDMLVQFGGVKAEIVTDPERARGNEIPRIVGDSSRLRRATGWKPEVPLEQTLRDLLAYWEERVGQAG